MFTSKGWIGLYGMVGVIALSVVWFTTAKPVVVLPRVRLAPGYTLQNTAGANVSSEDARGKLNLYTFAYSECRQECAGIYASLRALDEALAGREALSPPLRVITLSIDPARDTPEKLAQAGLPFTPRALDWVWLTGSETWMKSVAGSGFEVLYRAREDGSIFFAPRYVLVDGEGMVRAIYEGAELDTDVFLTHLDLITTEIAQSQGATRLAYEAAHFFACYVPQH